MNTIKLPNSNIQKRSVLNIDDDVYNKIKSFCESQNLKISKWAETTLLNIINIHEKELKVRCIIFRGSKEDLKALNRDKKVEINGWGGIGNLSDENFWQLSKRITFKSEDLLLSYIIEYVKKTYPKIEIKELDYLTLKESNICGH